MSFDFDRRASGIVLHVTSLPGPHGVGDLGEAAHAFVDWLAAAGQRVWQVLPVNPVGPGDSPYQCPSAFAGSELMVALPPLVQAGWLAADALAHAPAFHGPRADYAQATPWRRAMLQQAAEGFFARASAAERQRFEAWQAGQADWLPEWTLFAALKAAHGHRAWWDWAPELVRREPAALQAAAERLRAERAVHAFTQWCFDEQLQALRTHAAARGVALMGDLPIFVAHDSADVWARPDLFQMDEAHRLTAVAGVPPDAYSPDGQRWGNPLYRWERMQAEGFAWWIARLRRAFAGADLVRIDHFRGFAGYWAVPADCPTAREGAWVPAPGQALFEAITRALGPQPIVAEDLGTITPDVVALRDGFGLPGMRIVYEGLMWGPAHPFLPHHHVPRALAYSSTHDSDTVAGWWAAASDAERAFAADYLGCSPAPEAAAQAVQALLRATSASVAALALFPLQDVLALGREHRMNRPGTAEGNWGWRADAAWFTPERAAAMRRLAEVTGRA